jgi:hypothetical protein
MSLSVGMSCAPVSSRKYRGSVLLYPSVCVVGRGSLVCIATCYGWRVRGSNLRVGRQIFRSLPHRLWGQASHLCGGYRVSFPGLKRPWPGVDHPPPSSAKVKERVPLLPLRALMACSRVNFTCLHTPKHQLCLLKYRIRSCYFIRLK